MKNTLLIAVLLGISISAYGQKPTDTELWTGGTFQLRLNKPLSIDLEEQIRFNDTISRLYKSYTELGLKYRLGEGFYFKGMYRHTIRPAKNPENRVALDFGYGFEKKGFPLMIDYRLRFQDKLGKSQTYVRNKLSLSYKLSKLVDPFVAYELFFRFNGKNEFRTTRFTAGLDWRLLKDLHFNTYFRIQNDINVKNPERQMIIGATLEYKLKFKKKDSSSSS